MCQSKRAAAPGLPAALRPWPPLLRLKRKSRRYPEKQSSGDGRLWEAAVRPMGCPGQDGRDLGQRLLGGVVGFTEVARTPARGGMQDLVQQPAGLLVREVARTAADALLQETRGRGRPQHVHIVVGLTISMRQPRRCSRTKAVTQPRSVAMPIRLPLAPMVKPAGFPCVVRN